jgi:hypothetical protein
MLLAQRGHLLLLALAFGPAFLPALGGARLEQVRGGLARLARRLTRALRCQLTTISLLIALSAMRVRSVTRRSMAR